MKGPCPSGKRTYYNEASANRAVSVAAQRGELPPMRHYKCPDCPFWHLSKLVSRTRTPVSKRRDAA